MDRHGAHRVRQQRESRKEVRAVLRPLAQLRGRGVHRDAGRDAHPPLRSAEPSRAHGLPERDVRDRRARSVGRDPRRRERQRAHECLVRRPAALGQPADVGGGAARGDARRRARQYALVKSVDPLGRTFLVVEDNGPAGKYPTRTGLDIQGNARSVTDARGNVVHTQSFDMEKRGLDATSADAGDRTRAACAMSQGRASVRGTATAGS